MKSVLLGALLALAGMSCLPPAAAAEESQVRETADLIERVRDDDPAIAGDAVRQLTDRGDAALPAVVDAYFAGMTGAGIDEVRVRERYLGILRARFDGAMLALLKPRFFDESTHVWLRGGVRDLLSQGDAALMQATLAAWFGEAGELSEFVISDGVHLLTAFPGEAVTDMVLRWVGDDALPRSKRRLALRVVTRLRLAAAGERLVAMLQDPRVVKDVVLLHDVADGIGALRRVDAVPVIEVLLREQSESLARAQYFLALGLLASDEAVAILRRYLTQYGDARQFDDCIPVVIAMGESGRADLSADLLPWLKKKSLRTYAIGALGDIRALEAAPALGDYLDDPELINIVNRALQSIAGETMGFTYGQNPRRDAEAVQKWKDWIAALPQSN